MPYNASKHSVFVERLVNMRSAISDLNAELSRLLQIYEHQATSGDHAAFVDTTDQTKAEIQAFLTLLTGLQSTLTSPQSSAVMAPFTKP